MMDNHNSLRIIAVFEILTAAGLILFWSAFFTIGLAPADPPPGYFQFEHSFPVPDLFLAALLLAAGSCLLHPDPKRRRLGRSLSLAGAGALMFLGAVDVSFNLQNGMYTISLPDSLMAAVINTWCILLGATVIVRCSRA